MGGAFFAVPGLTDNSKYGSPVLGSGHDATDKLREVQYMLERRPCRIVRAPSLLLRPRDLLGVRLMGRTQGHAFADRPCRHQHAPSAVVGQPRGADMAGQAVKPPFAWAIHEGDCIDVMRTLAPESIDAVITSPPYAMQRKATYGGVPEADYPEWTVAWMREVRRVLKPDGNVVINIRPHLKAGQISDYTLRTRLALREDDWIECEELIWHKKGGAPLGAVKRPRRSWESLHWFAKHGRPFCDPKAAGSLSNRVGIAGGRSGQHIRSNVSELKTGIARVPDLVDISTRKNENDSDLNRHPAPYPPALAEWIARLVCPPGGTILDPFNGSGSTGVAAIRNGWSYVGIDAVPEYAAMSRKRLEAMQGVLDFGDTP